MVITDTDRVIKLKPYQDRFIFSESRYPAIVAAWGTGKSMCGIHRAMIHAETYPNNLGIIFRKEFTDLRDSTIKDFERYTGLQVNSSREVVLPNKTNLMFRHMEEINNLQNINAGFFLIEQAEELDNEDPYMMLLGRLRRDGVPHWGGILANTKGHNWIYRLWKLGEMPGSELIEAKTSDNADVLPKDYIESLETLKKAKPKMWARFVDNSWEEEDTIDVVISPEWVRNSKDRFAITNGDATGVVSIDVARYGDDKTVFYAIESYDGELYRCVAKEKHEKKDTMEVVGRALLFAQKHGISTYAVDEIGVGAGVVDRLREMGHKVIAVNTSEKSTEPEKYYNTRAEIYGSVSELFRDGKVSVMQDDIELQEQLSWARYKVIKSNGVIQIEAKDDIKKRYGKSPDEADAYLNGVWVLSKGMARKRRQRDGDWQDGNYVPDLMKLRYGVTA